MVPFEPLNVERIKTLLRESQSGFFGNQIHYYQQIGSTNDRVRELAKAGAPEGTVVIADEQIKGRGRMGRSWAAPANSSLMFTTLFRPDLATDKVQQLVMVCGLAIAEACELTASVRVDVKWPNDLQITGKKVTGILPESAMLGDSVEWVIVGTGINVNQVFTPDDPLSEIATSLRTAADQEIDREQLFAAIMVRYSMWHGRLDNKTLLDSWRSRCITLGQRVQVGLASGTLTGVAKTISSNGALILTGEDGREYTVHASEATILQSN
jgi:BirA family transcriptional regulator, biotin operon repressor / biotin---[acetyl-CoA-carboxylase] ligase